MRINGRDQECLLDSGSEVSVIPASLVRKSDIQQTDQSLRAVNGTGIKILGEAELPVNTSKYQTTVKGLVTEHVSEVLLGIDWLTENNADWNFRDGSVSLNGYRHKLNTRPKGQKWCRRVVVQEDTEVPPRSEQNLGCRVMFHGASKCQADQRWETEPAALRCGLIVARTLTPTDQFEDVPIRVLNLEDQPRRVKAVTGRITSVISSQWTCLVP